MLRNVEMPTFFISIKIATSESFKARKVFIFQQRFSLKKQLKFHPQLSFITLRLNTPNVAIFQIQDRRRHFKTATQCKELDKWPEQT